MALDRRAVVALVGLPMWFLLAGCQTVGPRALGAGRGAYNDVIARTSSEQTLGLIVRLRYSDPIGLLTVSSVTASLKFSAQATGQAGFGSRENFAGNLVPLSAGVAYEDSPTISYTPVEGPAFLREWLAPVTLDTLALLLQTAAHQATLVLPLVERFNGLSNAANATLEERTRFRRAVTLLAELRDLGIASWGKQSGEAGRYELALSQYSGHITEVQELLRLLELKGDPARESTIRIPIALGVRAGDFDGLAVQTRSVAEVMLTAAASVEVPSEHILAGFVEARANSAGTSDAMPILRIRSSRNAPDRANVAVHHRGWWFYVDDTDLTSKAMFQRIQMLFLTRLSEATHGQTAPVLTIPVK